MVAVLDYRVNGAVAGSNPGEGKTGVQTIVFMLTSMNRKWLASMLFIRSKFTVWKRDHAA